MPRRRVRIPAHAQPRDRFVHVIPPFNIVRGNFHRISDARLRQHVERGRMSAEQAHLYQNRVQRFISAHARLAQFNMNRRQAARLGIPRGIALGWGTHGLDHRRALRGRAYIRGRQMRAFIEATRGRINNLYVPNIFRRIAQYVNTP